ncbi:hypothetical protein M427DRAFT_175900 [Gonapodya prolifera JEL478]|uniref:Uncharacterized protein n=1 Tax=Gonapodya prolifera (strain JEL478) TaxID=1344416 RepID=A0A139APV3_GONPJ|nr:hypothetical protein M427DRAFT_175900 [Gonapodya prolifera JEL478]|eukprot:KXS18779.1 hypothetical protein M427DRAFT_175900 [Gonapodya prolifera JEL478]
MVNSRGPKVFIHARASPSAPAPSPAHSPAPTHAPVPAGIPAISLQSKFFVRNWRRRRPRQQPWRAPVMATVATPISLPSLTVQSALAFSALPLDPFPLLIRNNSCMSCSNKSCPHLSNPNLLLLSLRCVVFHSHNHVAIISATDTILHSLVTGRALRSS